jgi:hypothetical protein
MFHHVVRPLLRVALLSVLLGAVPPAPVPVVRATSQTTSAILGPPLAAAPTAAAAVPLAAPTSTTVPHPEPPPPSLPARASDRGTSIPDFGRLPLSFVPNVGQADSAVLYHVRGMGGSIFFTPQEVVLVVPTDSRRSRPRDRDPSTSITSTLAISMSIVRIQYQGAGANPTITPANRLPGAVNYFIGNDPAQWHANLSTYDGIVYQQLYPGIDLRYTGTDGQLKSIYTVAPGANPSRLRWRYSGAKDVQVDADGNLLILIDPIGHERPRSTTPYTLTEQAPVAWQSIGDRQVPVDVRAIGLQHVSWRNRCRLGFWHRA